MARFCLRLVWSLVYAYFRMNLSEWKHGICRSVCVLEGERKRVAVGDMAASSVAFSFSMWVIFTWVMLPGHFKVCFLWCEQRKAPPSSFRPTKVASSSLHPHYENALAGTLERVGDVGGILYDRRTPPLPPHTFSSYKHFMHLLSVTTTTNLTVPPEIAVPLAVPKYPECNNLIYYHFLTHAKSFKISARRLTTVLTSFLLVWRWYDRKKERDYKVFALSFPPLNAS